MHVGILNDTALLLLADRAKGFLPEHDLPDRLPSGGMVEPTHVRIASVLLCGLVRLASSPVLSASLGKR